MARRLVVLVLAGFAALGCARAASPALAPSPASQVEGPAASAPVAPVVVSAPAPSDTQPPLKEALEEEGAEALPAEAASPALKSSTDVATAPHPLEDGRKPDPKRALPSITMRHVGMHVGGGKNSDEEKKPFLVAIEKRTGAILRCYRAVRAPGTDGTFGVDLRIATAGGSPLVQKTRHKLGDLEFEACMHRAFESVQFPSLPRPTIVSYSLRFEIEKR